MLQTATATSRTLRLLEAEFPEVIKWNKILNVPFRPNISIIVPPPAVLPSQYQDLLAPFVRRITDYQEPHLIIVRSINSGTEVYFHLLKMLCQDTNDKTVAFYHRSTSESRKQAILHDLSLPINCPSKRLKAVVATISLGVGVDIRVKNVVCLGLGSSPENLVQEAGRCLRGTNLSSDTERGLAFFFQRGAVAAVHCPPASDCRSLISDPLPHCQTKTLFRFFDPEFDTTVTSCDCCFSCVSRDAGLGCQKCATFLETYLPIRKASGRGKSLRKGLKAAILDLFQCLNVTSIEIETRLCLTVENFTNDFVKVYDEIDGPSDIQSMWHVPEELARDLFDVCVEFLTVDNDDYINDDETDFNSDDDDDENSDETSHESSSDPEYSEESSDTDGELID